MSRPVLMLLPGLLCDAAVWESQGVDLHGIADCRVPDYGLRDSIDSMAEHVLEVAPPGPFALAGHSMGGRVALAVIARAPQRVERLALLDTGFQPLAAGAAGETERAGRHKLLSRAQNEGMRAMGRDWARGMVHPDRVDTPVFDAVLDMIARSTPERFAAQIRALLDRPDAAPLLPRLTCPTLLLCGQEDAWSPLDRHAEMQRLIPGSRLQVIAHSGHMTTMEQPEAVSDALARWLTPELGAQHER